MITEDTARKIALAYREMETGEQLLTEINETIDRRVALLYSVLIHDLKINGNC